MEKWGEPGKRIQLEKEGSNLPFPTGDKLSVGGPGRPGGNARRTAATRDVRFTVDDRLLWVADSTDRCNSLVESFSWGFEV